MPAGAVKGVRQQRESLPTVASRGAAWRGFRGWGCGERAKKMEGGVPRPAKTRYHGDHPRVNYTIVCTSDYANSSKVSVTSVFVARISHDES